MIGHVLVVAAITLPPATEAVRIAADGWPVREMSAPIAAPRDGETLWWWSPQCAPRQLTVNEAVQCAPIETKTVHVVDEQGKAIEGARVLWASREMNRDLPDAMLPFAITNAEGMASFAAPVGVPLHVRVAGPRVGTWWRTLEKTSVRLVAQPAAELQTNTAMNGGERAERAIFEIQPAGVIADGVRSWAAGERGEIAIPPLPSMPASYVAWSRSGAPVAATVNTSSLPRQIELPRGHAVEGRLVDRRKQPIHQASVELIFALPRLNQALRRRALTGDDGRFVFRGIPAGAAQLGASKDGFGTRSVTAAVKADVALDDVILSPARSVEVRVVDVGGKPVPHAPIQIRDGMRVIAGNDGRARLDGIAAGEEVSGSIRAAGFRFTEFTIPETTSGPVIVRLSRGVRITGTVVDAETNAPANGGSILVINNAAQKLETIHADGAFDIAGLDAGTLALEIRANGLAPHVIREREAVEEELIRLGIVPVAAGTRASGTIVDRDSGAPVPGATVRALRRREHGFELAFAMRDWVAATADDRGAFTLAGLADGPQLLMIETPGYAARMLTVDGVDEPLSIELDRARELIVRCAPASRCGAEARLLIGGAEHPWSFVSAAFVDGVAKIASAAPGSAQLRLLRGQEVVHERSVTISSDAHTAIDIRLGATRVEGLATTAGRPRPEGVVTLERVAARSASVPVCIESRVAEGVSLGSRCLGDRPATESAAVDGDGRFVFPELDGGEYKVTWRDGASSGRPQHVLVPDIALHRLILDLPAGELRGRVTHADASAARWTRIRVTDAAGETHVAQSDESGAFAISGLRPGTARVDAATTSAEASASVAIAAEKPASVELVLQRTRAAEIDVHVVDPAGRPLPGAFVFLAGDSQQRIVQTASDGAAKLQLAQPGVVRLAGYHAAFGWSWSGAIDARRDEPSEVHIAMTDATGSVVVNGPFTVDGPRGSLMLYAPTGFPAHSAFAVLGVPTSFSGGHLRLGGLPQGTYRMLLGGEQRVIDIQPRREAAINLH